MSYSKNLIILQRIEALYYKCYRLGLLNKYEYLDAIRPLDRAIDSIEMSICLDVLLEDLYFEPKLCNSIIQLCVYVNEND